MAPEVRYRTHGRRTALHYFALDEGSGPGVARRPGEEGRYASLTAPGPPLGDLFGYREVRVLPVDDVDGEGGDRDAGLLRQVFDPVLEVARPPRA